MTDKPKPVLMKSPGYSELPDVDLPAGSDVELARILRHAAGLEDLPDPTEYQPPADGFIWVMHYVWSILSAVCVSDDHLKYPRKLARELEALQLDLGDIRRRIEKIDDGTKSNLNRFGSPNYLAFHETNDADRMEKLWRAVEGEPPETWTVPAAEAAIRRLERAIPAVIDRVKYQADRAPATGRKRNWKAHAIAETVAEYVRDVTGGLPGPRRKYSGSNFELTLVEIFDLFDVDADPQQPAKAALSKLGKNAAS